MFQKHTLTGSTPSERPIKAGLQFDASKYWFLMAMYGIDSPSSSLVVVVVVPSISTLFLPLPLPLATAGRGTSNLACINNLGVDMSAKASSMSLCNECSLRHLMVHQ